MKRPPGVPLPHRLGAGRVVRRVREDVIGVLVVATISCAALAISLGGCAPEFWNGVAQGMANTPAAGTPVEHKLMIFGGPGHKTYLGCLSCSEYANDSVFNIYGPHGTEYSNTSVFNQYSQFGGPYGEYSPCNASSSDPPVIVDEAGNFYGRLTVNPYHPQATHDPTIVAWLQEVVCK
jgi:hypothetical protein